MKAEILNNPQVLLKYFTLSQTLGEKGLIGYRIGPGNYSRLFDESSLQAGDVAVRFNGTDLTTASGMNLILQRLSATSAINLTVQRGNQFHDIYISL
ncbi:hypothetical protein [Candidatus Enterovibrio escicola]|uniref:hypothetical protein n=1 Tax=Candidatus Enterovibrio escicola TaxID=1927127 RepID=UPI001CC24433|nr:hypothetical protein [Candidatus Enterovibrio escacola]